MSNGTPLVRCAFFHKEVTKMDMKHLSKTQKLTLSGAVMAIYIVVMYFT